MDQTEENRQFIQRLSTWWKADSPRIQAVAAGELAPGIICIADRHQERCKSLREVDVFFDLNRYGFRDESLWEDGQLRSMKAAGLGCLSGAGFSPRLRTPDDAYRAVSEHIVLRNGKEVVLADFRLAEEFEWELLSS